MTATKLVEPSAKLSIAALIVAAGRGVRAGDGPPKQYRRIAGEAVLSRAIRALAASAHVDRVLVCIRPEDEAAYAEAAPDEAKLLPPVHGGEERALTVRAGLEALAALDPPPDAVLIHDAARPFVNAETLDALAAALSAHDGAVAAIPVVDALRRADGVLCADGVDRADLWRAQTPQAFALDKILDAHRRFGHAGALDDVEIAREAGLSVALTMSDESNFKITTPADFARAERMLMSGETRIGQGFDVHAFAEGDAVILCGVEIPFEKRLSGHSDADVAMHALTDAIFGALAEGDIGRWFPPSEPEWKGAASSIFLEKAMERVAARGARLINADLTIMCERPKIGPHADAMRARLAEIMNLDIERISVKATTTERLGFTGREEGIAALAAVQVAFP